jgi:pentatricopeptide repeat-containing protein PET309
MIIPFSQSISLYGKNSVECRAREDNAILDFLYPPKTLALLKKLSTYRLERWVRHANSLTPRLFSSSSKWHGAVNPHIATDNGVEALQKASHDNEEWSDAKLDQLYDMSWMTEIPPSRSGATIGSKLSPKEHLMSLLDGPIPLADHRRFSHAWTDFNQLNAEKPDFGLAAKLMTFLSFSQQERDRVRFLLLMKSLEFPEQYQFWKSILLSVYAQKFDTALEMHEMALSHTPIVESGSDVLLAHAIWNQKWDLARVVFQRATSELSLEMSNLETSQTRFARLWNLTIRLPNLVQLGTQYLEERLVFSRDLLDPFTYQFICVVLANNVLPKEVDQLLSFLRTYNIHTAGMYKIALSRKVHLAKRDPKSITPSQFASLHKMWSAYRIYCKPGDFSHSIIRDLLSALTECADAALTVDAQYRGLLADILDVCADAKIHLEYEFLVKLMWFYAQAGHSDTVKVFERHLPNLRDLSSRSTEEWDMDILRMKSLLRVHAVQQDLAGAKAEFESIISQIPRAKKLPKLWNELISVYSRTGHIQEAFRVALQDMPAAGINLTRQTILHLVWQCGWSGDTSAVLAVMQIAEQYNIQLDEWMIRSLIQAYLKNHSGSLAEEMEQLMQTHQITMDTWSKPAMTVMFNELLFAIARRRDLRSSNKIYLRMTELEMKISASTFGALIILLCNLGETDQALKLVGEVMPVNEVKPDSFHYAHLMRGYCIERRWEQVLAVHQYMIDQGMTPSSLSESQYLEAFAMIHRTNPTQDTKVLKQLWQTVSNDSINIENPITEPPVLYSQYTDRYFCDVLEPYVDINAFEMVQAVQELYWDHQKREGLSDDPSLIVIKAFMKAALFAGQHAVVSQLWEKSLKILSNYVRALAFTLRQVSSVASGGSFESFNERLKEHVGKVHVDGVKQPSNGNQTSERNSNDMLTHGLDPDNIPASQISVAHLLSLHLSYYMESLAQQSKFSEIIKVMQHVQRLGFKPTNMAWNFYILLLCRSLDMTNLIAAFRATEVHMMPYFMGIIPSTSSPPSESWRLLQQRRRRLERANYTPSLFYTSLKTLKEVYDSSDGATVRGNLVGIDTNSEIPLISVLHSIAPTLSNYLKTSPPPHRWAAIPKLVHWRLAEEDAKKREKARGEYHLRQTPHSAYLPASYDDNDNSALSIDELLVRRHDQRTQSKRRRGSLWRWPGEPLSEGARRLLEKAGAKSTSTAQANDEAVKITRQARVLSRVYSAVEKKEPMRVSDLVRLLKKGLPSEDAKKVDNAVLEDQGISTQPLKSMWKGKEQYSRR